VIPIGTTPSPWSGDHPQEFPPPPQGISNNFENVKLYYCLLNNISLIF